MTRLEKEITDKLFEETIKTLDWRRAVLWREMEKLQSEIPWEAKEAHSKVSQLKGELEKDFNLAHKILAKQH